MAAPFRQAVNSARKPFQHLFVNDTVTSLAISRNNLNYARWRCCKNFSNSSRSRSSNSFDNTPTGRWRNHLASALLGSAAIGAAYLTGRTLFHFQSCKVFAGLEGRPNITPSRSVVRDLDDKGLKLTLYQFQTCPFCCKVRAMLDYHGFSYDVVEVNSVTKKQIKWSDYQKVPVLVVQPADSKQEVILKDSTVIISVLESYLHDRNTSIAKFNSYFPCLEEKDGKKTKYDFPNKYFIMFQDKSDLETTPKQRSEERKWRKWADNHLVHMLSPNVYRSAREALQAFNYFSEVGQWEQNFSTFERLTVIYLGAFVMYVMGIILKRKYELKDDVRQSLYDACNEWLAALGSNKKFMGGHEPNLADLAVYGVLNSIEGCAAFNDMLQHTKIGAWYDRMKVAIGEHQGAHPLNSKSTPSDLPKSLRSK